MKILKKSLSLLLAVAMIASLIVINVSAAGAAAKYTFKVNDVADKGQFYLTEGLTAINMDVYLSTADDGNVTISGIAGLDVTYPTDIVTDIAWADNAADTAAQTWSFTKDTGYVSIYLESNLSGKEFVASEKLGTFTFTLNKAAITAGNEYTFAASSANDNTFADPDYTFDVSTMKYVATFSDAVEITGLKTPVSITDKAVGTAQADLGLPAKVTATAVKAGTETAAADVENVAVTWTGYDPMVLTAQTLTGTLVDPDGEGEGVSIAADIVVQATVTLNPITADYTTDAVTDDIKAVKTALEGADLDAYVKEELPATVAIKKGDVEDTVAVTWGTVTPSADFAGATVADKTATVEGTLGASTKGLFDVDGDTITATVTVVPAQIAGAKVEVKGASLTTVPQVTITVPASEVKDANEVIVTITDGETTKEQKVEAAKADFVIDDKGTENDATDDTAKLVVKFDEKYNKLGYENGDVITVGVTLNGAALADEEGAPLAIEKTVKKPVSNGSPSNVPSSTTKPVVTPEDPTEDPKDEPTTPDEPVVTPVDPDVVPQTEAPFADVPADHWAAAPVAQLKEAGVVNGSGDGNFAPEADITRAEFTKMVVGVMGLEVAAAEVAFEDCTAADWFTPYVAAAVEAGLVNGVSETEFAPNATITREQAFAIIGRAIDAEATTAVAFEDAADIDEYAAPYVALLVELGIVGGYDDNTIRPDANITRAEAAKLLAGFMDKLNADAEVLPETEEVVEEATEEVVEEEATEEVVEEEATEEVVDEK